MGHVPPSLFQKIVCKLPPFCLPRNPLLLVRVPLNALPLLLFECFLQPCNDALKHQSRLVEKSDHLLSSFLRRLLPLAAFLIFYQI